MKSCQECGKQMTELGEIYRPGDTEYEMSNTGVCTRCSEKILKLRPKIHRPQHQNLPEILGNTTCDILKSHHDAVKDDPERLSTDFIKKLSGIPRGKCKEIKA